MACCGRTDRAVGAPARVVVGYEITYRDGSKEEVMSTDLAAIRKKITLAGGGTRKPILSK